MIAQPVAGDPVGSGMNPLPPRHAGSVHDQLCSAKPSARFARSPHALGCLPILRNIILIGVGCVSCQGALGQARPRLKAAAKVVEDVMEEVTPEPKQARASSSPLPPPETKRNPWDPPPRPLYDWPVLPPAPKGEHEKPTVIDGSFRERCFNLRKRSAPVCSQIGMNNGEFRAAGTRSAGLALLESRPVPSAAAHDARGPDSTPAQDHSAGEKRRREVPANTSVADLLYCGGAVEPPSCPSQPRPACDIASRQRCVASADDRQRLGAMQPYPEPRLRSHGDAAGLRAQVFGHDMLLDCESLDAAGRTAAGDGAWLALAAAPVGWETTPLGETLGAVGLVQVRTNIRTHKHKDCLHPTECQIS